MKHELQALAIDVKCLDENGNEVDLRKQEDEAIVTAPIVADEKEEAVEEESLAVMETDEFEMEDADVEAFEETLDEEKEA